MWVTIDHMHELALFTQAFGAPPAGPMLHHLSSYLLMDQHLTRLAYPFIDFALRSGCSEDHWALACRLYATEASLADE